MKQFPPGPRGHFMVGNLPEFARDVLGFHEQCRDEFGDIVRIHVANRAIYLLNHPEHIHNVLVTNQRNFVKHSFFFRHVRALFGRGLLVNEGESWLRQRRLMAPDFHRDRITSYGETMVAFAERTLDQWRAGETRDVYHDMMALTLEIVAKVLFDYDVGDDVAAFSRALDAVMDEIAARFRRPMFVPDWVPLPGNLRYNAGLKALDKVVYRIIAEHHANSERDRDLLSMLMQVRDEHGGRMSDKQLRDEAITLLLAGHETTAIALSWTFYLLSRHPEVDAALNRELTRVLGDRAPTPADLPELRYTEHVILESMRLFPPAYGIGREALADCEIGGYHVPAGTTVFMMSYVLHRDPRWFDDPHAFRPERWQDGLAERLPRHAYMPFGGGPRICIGNNFAMMEAVLLLASIARRYKLAAVSNEEVQPFPTI